MITGVPLRLTLSAFGFMLAGMVTGNIYMIQLGLLPLLFVLLGMIIRQPTLFTVEPPQQSVSVDVGDELTVTRVVKVVDGLGLVTLGEELPPSFELLKGNNNQAAEGVHQDTYARGVQDTDGRTHHGLQGAQGLQLRRLVQADQLEGHGPEAEV
jgi:uncharacterized protein (DUF58 family)